MTTVRGTERRQLHIPVAIAQGGDKNQTVNAVLQSSDDVTEIDILVPGATYNHAYWDWPLDPERYSMMEMARKAGRATLACDRLRTAPRPGLPLSR